MIEELVSRVFEARDAAHAQHWATDSYAQHVALGEFYDGAIEAVDSLVENYQGIFGKIGNFSVHSGSGMDDFSAYIREELAWIEIARGDVTKERPVLENLYDELSAVYSKLLYKLGLA